VTRARKSSTSPRLRGTNSPPASNSCATPPIIPAHEEYFKIQIRALEKLPQPVKAEKWRRITFLYTTGEYLRSAKTVHGRQYHADLPDMDVDPQVLIALLGIQEIQSEYESDSSVNEDL